VLERHTQHRFHALGDNVHPEEDEEERANEQQGGFDANDRPQVDEHLQIRNKFRKKMFFDEFGEI